MHMRTVIPAAALALSLLVSGCVGNGPNTQQGAVAGGALGALAGGIIGNNHGHQTWAGAAIGGVVGAIAGGTIGNSIDQQRGTLYKSETEATTQVVVQQPPPPPAPPAVAEVIPAQPAPAAIWIEGYYAFDGVRYVWVSGHWDYPPDGYHRYVAAHWAYRGGNYVYIRGYWR